MTNILRGQGPKRTKCIQKLSALDHGPHAVQLLRHARSNGQSVFEREKGHSGVDLTMSLHGCYPSPRSPNHR